MTRDAFTRRRFLRASGAVGLVAGLHDLLPLYATQAWAAEALGQQALSGSLIDLVIRSQKLHVDGKNAVAKTINGTMPGPLLRLREGETATIRVRNGLAEDTSLHWHGVLVPAAMDGVPGLSFSGIKPGETFTYRFPVRQSGTYWYHSHSGLQEPVGVFGPLIIEPREGEQFAYDREYVVMFSDWSFEDPNKILAKLKKQSGYYNFQKRTMSDFLRDVRNNGWSATVSERLEWGRMRMDPTDFADITGYTFTYLVNGLSPADNWTGLFNPGQRVRLRLINACAMTYLDVRIPGLKMTVVQADGQNVQPVTVDEFRMAVAETYDVIVEPAGDRPYTIFAEAMDRSGFARGTLAPREGVSAPIPQRRPRPLRTMADMGMGDMDMSSTDSAAGHDMQGMDMPTHNAQDMGDMPMPPAPAAADHSQHGAAPMPATGQGDGPNGAMTTHGPDWHGPGNSMVAMMPRSRLHEPGAGLENTGSRVLVYTDLRSLDPGYDTRAPGREIELHLTGNMERYMWSFDGRKYSEAQEPIALEYGERVRMTLVNDTMMEHPIHLHGMWMELDNGAGEHKPRKHTVNVRPGERLSFDLTADAGGKWAFHCHLLYHMAMGMFRAVSVSSGGIEKQG
jgi:CopA family copper-resistance protein